MSREIFHRLRSEPLSRRWQTVPLFALSERVIFRNNNRFHAIRRDCCRWYKSAAIVKVNGSVVVRIPAHAASSHPPSTLGAPNSPESVNLGIFDGEVTHAEINEAIAGSDKAILFGQQTRLPFFPDDRRLSKIHSGDPLALFLWKVLNKLPQNLREALIYGPISLTLVRDDTLLCFRDYRHHQAVHIGRRRRTIYLPELLLHRAEEMGYDYWAIAEGVIYASWMLLDYLLLAGVLKSYGEAAETSGTSFRLSEPYVRAYARKHNRHRRHHPEKVKSEVEQFVDGYRSALIRVENVKTLSDEPFQMARELFDPELEQRWARDKMERIADIFNYPHMFLFDRDIIHGAALELASRRRQNTAAETFADVLHDYRDALRFDPSPLMTTFCQGVVPKPRAIFIIEVVGLGLEGLSGFFEAYRAGEQDVVDLVHPLWMYLCSLSSDPAGVFARVGRCRALGRQKVDGSLDRAVVGILIRLDKSHRYKKLAVGALATGEAAREELLQVVGLHRLRDGDEWATFRMKKQAIVECACNLLDRLEASDGADAAAVERLLTQRLKLHEDEQIMQLLSDNPHRLTSDPSGVLMYVRTYKRTLAEFGPADPDTNFLLASILIRLDRCDRYQQLSKQLITLGPPAISALNEVLEQFPERDEKRAAILEKAREMLGHILLERQLRATAQEKARASEAAGARADAGQVAAGGNGGARDNGSNGSDTDPSAATQLEAFVPLTGELDSAESGSGGDGARVARGRKNADGNGDGDPNRQSNSN